jgi:spore coat protein U-like protein
MKRLTILLAALTLLMVSCGKRTDTFAFSGTVIGYYNCTLNSASISEMDFGYVVNLDTPDSVGGEYISNGVTYKNAILLYRTRARYGEGETISGTMYLDDNYSKAYCQYHFHLGIPEGVCYTLD